MHPSRDWVAIILAVGICTALNGFVFAAIYDALTDPAHSGLSENATQILTGWGGGIIGILGTVFGIHLGAKTTTQATQTSQDPGTEERRGLFS